ncbi:ABC transporter permease [Parvibaculum sp.]|uniref:ABC transporter permease n=1 Tax=Parvibaculum sp. TaxID=2024848 RepID=UPI001D95FAF2|nr:ABC transporter permease [Parvibaculum sp.]MBX3490181.1 ABC transporter permease [Parvibaculum sp.]MCW5725829.1 ABC transporter permease [Parvibaculum sp.]
MTHTPWPAEGARRFGAVNWLGMWTLYLKEVRRFWKVMTQTVAAPVITTLLYLAIFALAIGKFRPDVHGVPFVEFLAPGLIMMTMIQNAFANTSSSLLISKIQGNIVDVLMPPLSPMELNIGIALAGVTRGLVCGTVTALAMLPFVNLGLAHLWALLFFAAGASLMLSLFGILGGIWSEKFDHLQAVTNFVILPLTFLSGTFYSVTQLPDFAHKITLWNPVFYLIDGFRYGVTGHADGAIEIGVALVIGVNLVLWVACHMLFRTGYRLKA